MSTDFGTILYDVGSGIARITLNRPEKRNALNNQMLDELFTAVELANADSAARCIVITGAGDKAFCAGADLGGFASGESFFENFEGRGLFPRLFLALENGPKPSLAAINGHCVAGGFGLAMACDLAVAKAGFKMGTPEIARGLFPYMISTLISRAVPRRKAFEMMFMGELFSTEAAADLNVVNKTVPPSDYEDTVLEWAGRLASFSPAVLNLGKRAMAKQAGMSFDGALSYLQGLLSVNVMMDDAAEGISAFFEKRDPQWKGK